MTDDIIDIPEDNEGVKPSKHRFFDALEDPCVEYRLQRLLNINPKVWNDIKEAGHLPKQGTYREVLTALISYYRNKKESTAGKAKDLKSNDKNAEELVLLTKQEKISNIRLNRAREEGVYIQNMEKRGELISKQEEFSTISIMVQSIATILRGAADANPDLQETIDKCFVSLNRIGETILKQAEEDEKNYITMLMERPLHLQEYLDTLLLSADTQIFSEE